MGGQQFASGGVVLDTRSLDRILDFDAERGIVEVEAGIEWPRLVRELRSRQRGRPMPWGIAQKQTGADRLTLGGALGANVHGRGLRMKPFVGDVESFVLVDARGEARECSRTANADLFRLAIGGYGLFGVVHSVRLRLVPLRKIRRVVEILDARDLPHAFEHRIAEGCLYGDFQFSCAERSEGFLRRGVFSCYRPVDDATPIPEAQRRLSAKDWAEMLYLAHTDKEEAFRRYAAHYRSTAGQVYWTDTHQLSYYLDDYHRALDERLGAPEPASEIIGEIYVPRGALVSFLETARDSLRASRADVIYGTVRLIERDDETFLAWAREAYACVVFNLHTPHTVEGIERSAEAFRGLISDGIALGGSHYLTYHRFATREQVLACYPQMPEFLRLKRLHDPEVRFESEWYRHHVRQLGAGAFRPCVPRERPACATVFAASPGAGGPPRQDRPEARSERPALPLFLYSSAT